MSGIITATSDVGICSEALVSLGDEPIADFNENSKSAQACSALYASARDDLIRRHTWNGFIKRAIGSPDANPPAWGYAQRFPLPADCVRLLGVVILPDQSKPGAALGKPVYTTDYALEGGAVLCNAKCIGFHYLYRNDNAAMWSPGFVRMMVLRMRWALAFPVTRDVAIEGAAASVFAAELKTYKTLDGAESPAIELPDGDYMNSRW